MDPINELREKRRKMFEQMGVTSAGQVMTESVVATGAQNLTMLQKLNQIKSGAAKSELNKYINAKSNGGSVPGAADFTPIPVSKPKSRGQNPQAKVVDPKFKVELESFSSPPSVARVDNSELSMLDAMFGGDSSPRMSPQQLGFDSGVPTMKQGPMNTKIDLDSTLSQMPMFKAEHAVQRAKGKATNTYLKFAQETPIGEPEDYMMESQSMNAVGMTPQLKMMMETIARSMAEQTMRRVLSEFTEQQKGKKFFEIYNKEQSIVKTSDGKLYRLTPVQVKKKN